MFYINKFHKGQSGKGYVVECGMKDDQTGEWKNVKIYVPDAAQYAGKSKDELPAALAMEKDGALVIKAYRKDVFNGKKPTDEKPKKEKKEADDDIPF